MTLKQLFDYLDSRVALCHTTGNRRTRSDFRHQAYGAIDFYITNCPEGAGIAQMLWENEYLAKFEELIYGE